VTTRITMLEFNWINFE